MFYCLWCGERTSNPHMFCSETCFSEHDTSTNELLDSDNWIPEHPTKAQIKAQQAIDF